MVAELPRSMRQQAQVLLVLELLLVPVHSHHPYPVLEVVRRSCPLQQEPAQLAGAFAPDLGRPLSVQTPR